MTNVKGNRNIGIDFLRILSTYSILLLHIMGHGGIRDALTPGNINYYVLWFVMLASYCGVNCFALISGYVGYHEKEKTHSSAKFIDLWFQVVFYCVITVIFFMILKMPGMSIRDLIEAFFPITFEKYWYFSAYLGVFIFMPLINKCIREFSNAYLFRMMIIGVASYSFLATIITRYSDPFSLKGGFSAVWLIFLYFIGAFIKKFKIEDKIKVSALVKIILACLLITWIWKVALISIVGHGLDDMLILYLSPTILLMSVCQLLLFSKLKYNRFMTKAVSIIAPTTFGIYLFQDSDYFRKYIVAKQYAGYALKNPFIMVGLILLTGLVQFLIGFLIDKSRIILFNAAKMKQISNQIGSTIDDTVNKSIKWAEEYLKKDN